MITKRHLATITIIVGDRQTNVKSVNQLLSESGNLIMARLGVNVQPTCIEHCTGMITVAIKGTIEEIKSLTKKLDSLYGIVAKANIMTD